MAQQLLSRQIVVGNRKAGYVIVKLASPKAVDARFIALGTPAAPA